MIIKGYELDTLKPGTVVMIGNKVYIKMVDRISCHIEGCLFEPTTGNIIHWSQVAYHDSDVETLTTSYNPLCPHAALS
jgi:hypothetical protein